MCIHAGLCFHLCEMTMMFVGSQVRLGGCYNTRAMCLSDRSALQVGCCKSAKLQCRSGFGLPQLVCGGYVLWFSIGPWALQSQSSIYAHACSCCGAVRHTTLFHELEYAGKRTPHTDAHLSRSVHATMQKLGTPVPSVGWMCLHMV